MSDLERVVFQYFDAHQRGIDVRKSRRTNGSIESRIALLMGELQTLELSSEFNKVSMRQKDCTSPNLQNELIATLLQCIDAAMATEVSNDSNDSISAIFELAAAAASFGSPVAKAVLARSLQFTDVAMERVRTYACKLLGLCVEAIVSISDNNETLSFLDHDRDEDWKLECLEAAKDGLLPRLTDKSQAVRNAAIFACGAFGDAMHDETLQSLLWSLNHDPSPANRSAAIASVPCNSDSMDHLIERARDIKVKVRVDALNAIRTKMNVCDMTADHFCRLIHTGVTDRCEQTKGATATLICTSWIKAAKYDPLELVKMIGPIVNEDECEKLIGVLLACDPQALKDLSVPEIRAFQEGISKTPTVISQEESFKLTPEAVLFARVKVSRSLDSMAISASKKADLLSEVVPDIPLLCETVEKLVKNLTEAISSENDEMEERDTFVCRQLLQLAQLSDLTEEGSRRHFVAAMKGMLSSVDTPDDLLEEGIKAMAKAHDQEGEHLRTISEIVEGMVGGEEALYCDVAAFTQLRIVSILSLVLENASANMAMHPILSKFGFYITHAVTSANAMVRECGVSCLGRLALLSDEPTVSAAFKPLLLKVISTESESMEIRAQAMLAICDLSLLFGGMLNSEPVSFVSLVSDLLKNAQAGIVAVAAEVAAKLFLCGKVDNADLMGGLLVAFFNKSFADLAEHEDADVSEVGSLLRMQQILCVFFPAYSMKSKEAKHTLISSIGPMLDTVTSKKTKRGAAWNISKMIEYIISTAEIGKEEPGKVDDMKEEDKTASATEPSGVLAACVEVSSFLVQQGDNLTNTHLRALCKLLGGADIDVEADHGKTVIALKSNIEELSLLIDDDNCQRSLETVVELLEEVSGGESEDDENSTEIDDNESTGESLADALEKFKIVEDKENSINVGRVERTKLGPRPFSGQRLSLASVN